MDASILVAFFFLGMIGLIIYGIIDGFKRNSHKVDGSTFSQAGVTVNFKTSMIKIKSSTYSVDKIRNISWESGHGPHGNISEAYIAIDDFDTPLHKIRFMKTNDAEKFCQRLRMALEKSSGSISDYQANNAARIPRDGDDNGQRRISAEGQMTSESKRTVDEEYEMVPGSIEDNRVREAVQILKKNNITVSKSEDGWSVVGVDAHRQLCRTINQLEGHAVSAKAGVL